MSELRIDVTEVGQSQFVRLCGELNRLEADRVRDALSAMAGQTVTVDLAELRFLDSAGISALLIAERSITGRGCRMVVQGAQGGVRRVLEVVGMFEWLKA